MARTARLEATVTRAAMIGARHDQISGTNDDQSFLRGAALAVGLAVARRRPSPRARRWTPKALILKPLTLTKLDDLDFGTIIPSGSGDLVTINADTRRAHVADRRSW